MAALWQEALMLLHARGWDGELIDGACTALVEACTDGEFEGREVTALTPEETRRVLEEPVPADESRALCRLAEVHDRADAEGDAMRGALRDLDAFADALGEQ
ncbi:MAG: hypothetical protein ABFS41_13345 [Myxococcota bacterium]